MSRYPLRRSYRCQPKVWSSWRHTLENISAVVLQPDRTADLVYHSLQSEPESERHPAGLRTADSDFNCSGTESGEEIIK